MCLPCLGEDMFFIIPVGIGPCLVISAALRNLLRRHAGPELLYHSLRDALNEPEIIANAVWHLCGKADPPNDQLALENLDGHSGISRLDNLKPSTESRHIRIKF